MDVSVQSLCGVLTIRREGRRGGEGGEVVGCDSNQHSTRGRNHRHRHRRQPHGHCHCHFGRNRRNTCSGDNKSWQYLISACGCGLGTLGFGPSVTRWPSSTMTLFPIAGVLNTIPDWLVKLVNTTSRLCLFASSPAISWSIRDLALAPQLSFHKPATLLTSAICLGFHHSADLITT